MPEIPTPLSVADLLAAERPAKFLYFWKHSEEPGARVDAGCLSQWLPAEFTVDGVTFRSAEHYMMWRKARLFGDETTAARILAAGHPGEAKRLGGRAAGFDEEIWKRERFAIVVEGSLAKFGQHPQLRDYLLTTGNRVLVEASPLDRIWGIGLTATDPRAAEPAAWRGLNLLGFALMKARAELSRRAATGAS
ncbi:NADAR family protein [Actinoplanes sp. NPDC024001]|uniref:NADAR family protein n=1 Tax=Actinoplanes sp. NPDC024001 TaxID=3154598 RepID=UPI0033D18402